MISSLLKSVKTSPFGLMAIIFAILCIGLISLYSVAEIKSNDASSAFLRQIFFLGPALLLMLIFIIIPKKLIHELTPDFIVKGGDYKPEDVVGGDYIQSYGGKVVILPFVPGFSTTNIIMNRKGKDLTDGEGSS